MHKHPAIASLLCGALSAFALPFWNVIPLFFVGFSAFVFIASLDYKPLKSFLNGWCFGFGYFTVSLYWIGNAILIEAKDFWWAYPFALLGLPLYLAIYYGLATFLAQKLSYKQSIARLFALLFLITLADFARGYLFTGFPWNNPGLIWINIIQIAQIARYGGLIFLSALTFFWATALYVLYANFSKIFKGLYTGIAIATLLFSFIIGEIYITHDGSQQQHDFGKAQDIIIVQPNIPQSEKWDPALQSRNLQRYFDMTAQALLNAPKDATNITVIWPETALSFNTYHRKDINHALHALIAAPNNHPSVFLLTGLLDHYKKNGKDLFTNSLIGIDTQKEILHYNKHHLVPFGEYMPYQNILGWMPLVQIGSFEAGKAPIPISLPQGSTILPLICYEIIFPHHSFAAKKADFIVNITNDGWYGDSAGPAQHLAITRFRAIEQGKVILRAANTGVSAMINSNGVVIKKLDYNKKGTIEHNFTFSKLDSTIYQKYNYLLFILYLSIIFLLFYVFRSN